MSITQKVNQKQVKSVSQVICCILKAIKQEKSQAEAIDTLNNFITIL